MEFSIGDQVVHPKHGAGQITGQKQLKLVEGFENYYVIEVGDKGLVVHIPMRKMEELGVRPIMARSKLARVMDTLRDTPYRLSENFKTRQARVKEKLKTGLPLEIAEVVRDLTWRKHHASLSAADARLLDQGLDLLSAEIALVTNKEPRDAHKTISNTLTDAMENQVDGKS
jgi:CarD family transcriptional regulator